ncbi:MFS transporter [Streptomyces sp. NPDC085929]|uniref:MFS transporter n=1 Tax=Streptomyces sp. NPDC085929 TaxID=3365739 RepID=UPI0037D1477C
MRVFEPWMVSSLALGAGFTGFVALTIPPYVTKATGEAGAAGIVLAVISLSAAIGPVLGALADRYRAHRLVLCSGLLGMAVAFAAYGLSAQDESVFALYAILMGASGAALAAVMPVFVVGAGLPPVLVAKRLTAMHVMEGAGLMIGGALMGFATKSGWSFAQRFWLAAGFLAICFLTVLGTSAKPARRLRLHTAVQAVDDHAVREGRLRTVFLSVFGLFLMVRVLVAASTSAVTGQIANIMPGVFMVSPVGTDTAVAVAGLMGIGVNLAAGALVARRGGVEAYLAGAGVRLVGGLSLALAGTFVPEKTALCLLAMQITYMATPIMRLSASSVGARFATVPVGQANGWLISGSSIGAFLGNLTAGALAQAVGYNAINWFSVVAITAAGVLLVFGLMPAELCKRRAEALAPSAPDT